MATHYATFRYYGNGTYVSGVPSTSSSYYNNTSGQYPYTVYKQLGSAPSRPYFTFKGWARSSGASSGSAAGSNYSVLFPNADTSTLTFDFYATWEHVTVYVHYNANGGTGAPASQSHWGGYSVVLTTDQPTRSGYNFLGWSQQSDATSASYLPGGDYQLYNTVTLYAVWSPANSSIASISQNVPIDGTTQGTLNITRYNSSYTHDVTFSIGNSSFQLTNIGTSTNFTIPVSWLSEVPNATSAYATVSVVTKNGSAQVGQVVTASFVIVVPNNIVPTVTLAGSIVNDNSVVNSWGILLQGYSKVALSATGAAGTGASISSYSFSGSGVTQSGVSNSVTSSILTETGSKTWTVVITDSRGRTASATYTNTIYAYSNPSISSLSAVRSDSSGVRDEVSGANLSLSAIFAIASCNGNNQYTNAVAYKAHSASVWQNGPTDILSNYIYVVGNDGIDIDKTFDVRFTLSDSLGNSATYVIEVQSVVGYSFGLKNDRVRFGGVVQKPGFQDDLDLEQNGVAVFNDDATFNGDFIVSDGNVTVTLTAADFAALKALIS